MTPSGPVHMAKKITTIEKNPIDRCRQCGEVVIFDTDSKGNLIAQNRDTLFLHPCKDP